MITTLKNKEVMCRKSHICEWCGESIYAKTLAAYRVYIFDGDFNSEYMHNECYDAMWDSDLGYDEEFYQYEQERGKII